ncbi:hypothetical protein Tco_1314856 [Tanacetum coccineum]
MDYDYQSSIELLRRLILYSGSVVVPPGSVVVPPGSVVVTIGSVCGCFLKLMGEDDDDIGDLEDYLIRKDPPYYVDDIK